MKRETLKACPFCGNQPVTYFQSYERCRAYPIIKAYVKCEQCSIDLGTTVEYDTDTGITSVDSMLIGMETLIQKWNNRTTDQIEEK